MKTSITAVLMFTLASVAGCSQVTDNESWSARQERQINEALTTMGVVRGEVVNRVSNFTVNGYNAINDRALVITSGVHDHFLVTLMMPCTELNFAFTIGFDTGNRSYISSMDDVLVRPLHERGRFAPVRCPINRIYRLDDVAE